MVGALYTDATTRLSPEDVARGSASTRFILVGEAHDQGCDHAFQARLIEALAAEGRPPVIGLEMVSIDRQPILDRFDAGDLDVDEVGAALDWEASWGIPFALYRPIFEAARRYQLPVVALNLPRELVRDVAREGLEGLDPLVRARLPLILPPPPAQEEMLRQAFAAHAGQLPSADGQQAFERFVLVQSLWDSQMAAAAIRWSESLDREPVVLLAGGGHVINGWGIGSRLRALEPTATILEIMPWRGEDAIDPAGSALHYFCPPERPLRAIGE